MNQDSSGLLIKEWDPYARRTARIPNEQWDQCRDVLMEMHHSGATINQMLQKLREDFDMRATGSQLRTKLRFWGCVRARMADAEKPPVAGSSSTSSATILSTSNHVPAPGSSSTDDDSPEYLRELTRLMHQTRLEDCDPWIKEFLRKTRMVQLLAAPINVVNRGSDYAETLEQVDAIQDPIERSAQARHVLRDRPERDLHGLTSGQEMGELASAMSLSMEEAFQAIEFELNRQYYAADPPPVAEQVAGNGFFTVDPVLGKRGRGTSSISTQQAQFQEAARKLKEQPPIKQAAKGSSSKWKGSYTSSAFEEVSGLPRRPPSERDNEGIQQENGDDGDDDDDNNDNDAS